MPFIKEKSKLFGQISKKGTIYPHIHPFIAKKIYEMLFVKSYESKKKNNVTPTTSRNAEDFPFLSFPLHFLDLHCRNTTKIQEIANQKQDFNGEQIFSYWVVMHTTTSYLLQADVEGSFMNTFHQNFNMDQTTHKIKPTYLEDFYTDCFNGEECMLEDDLENIVDTCTDEKQFSSHIFLIKVNAQSESSKVLSTSVIPFNVIASLSFQLFPLANIIDGGLVAAYVNWMGTKLDHQRHGINSSLLGFLQCLISPDVTDRTRPPIFLNKKYSKIDPPTIFTKHGFGQNDHDGAIFFGDILVSKKLKMLTRFKMSLWVTN